MSEEKVGARRNWIEHDPSLLRHLADSTGILGEHLHPGWLIHDTTRHWVTNSVLCLAESQTLAHPSSVFDAFGRGRPRVEPARRGERAHPAELLPSQPGRLAYRPAAPTHAILDRGSRDSRTESLRLSPRHTIPFRHIRMRPDQCRPLFPSP